jgi:hypothetical protein
LRSGKVAEKRKEREGDQRVNWNASSLDLPPSLLVASIEATSPFSLSAWSSNVIDTCSLSATSQTSVLPSFSRPNVPSSLFDVSLPSSHG